MSAKAGRIARRRRVLIRFWTMRRSARIRIRGIKCLMLTARLYMSQMAYIEHRFFLYSSNIFSTTQRNPLISRLSSSLRNICTGKHFQDFPTYIHNFCVNICVNTCVKMTIKYTNIEKLCKTKNGYATTAAYPLSRPTLLHLPIF